MSTFDVHVFQEHGTRIWKAVLNRDGRTIASDTCNSRPHVSAWAKGCLASIQGETENPYAADKLDSRGRISLGRRGFRNAWQDGFDAHQKALRRFHHE